MKVKSILVSQPAPAAVERSPFQELTCKYNVKIDFSPFIRVERVGVKEFLSQRIDILAHTAVIFTNRSSIDHFFQICEETRVAVPETMKYFCVTETIALYLQKYIVYRKRKIFFGKGTFTDLMEQVVKHKDEKFLLPLPDPHKPEIPVTLDKLKLKYSKVIMSHTVGADISCVDIGKYDIVVFYSPLEIQTLKAKCPEIADRPMLAAFGNGTAVAASEAGYKVRVLAPTPESPSMVNALDKFIKKVNAGEVVEDIRVEREVADISHLKSDSKTTRQAKPKPKVEAKCCGQATDKKAPAKSKSA